jgi:hypothetical protein
MKGKCIGGPLDGQERESDVPYLTTLTVEMIHAPIDKPIPSVGAYTVEHIYVHAIANDGEGRAINVWQYVGTHPPSPYRAPDTDPA